MLNLKLVILIGSVILIGLIAGPISLSLAGDVGVRDQDACASVEKHAAMAVARLNATVFPHATSAAVETYELRRDAEPEARVQIDWAHSTASCVPLTQPAVITASASMDARAYGILVGELTSVLASGHATGHWANAWPVYWGTTISTLRADGQLEHDRAYEWSLAKWTAQNAAAAGRAGA